VLSLQRQATVLVNPRGGTAEFTKYSFPSKIMEYLLSGTPAVIRRLPGIPEEYGEHLQFVDGPAPTDLARALSVACGASREERRELGARAQRFVLEHKSGRAQAALILELIARVHRERPD
jgi:glycosyltransferase involved in cell wall biosynthesis